MKKHLRSFLISFFALWLAAYFLKGVSYSGGWQTLGLAALALTLINLLIKPLIKLLLLPINLITLGAFRWLVNVIVLYLVTLLIPQFQIKPFVLTGFAYQGFVVPTISLGTFWAYVVTSLVVSLVSTFFYWLAK
jgi:putative membrane protein